MGEMAGLDYRPKEKGRNWPLGLRDVAVVFRTLEERQKFQFIGLLVEHEFETAGVAAIHDVRAWPVFGGVMGDRRPASWTMPWHREEELIAEVNRLCQDLTEPTGYLAGFFRSLSSAPLEYRESESQHRPTARAFVEEHAAIDRHDLHGGDPARGTDHRDQ
jgi:hypothetical protein